MNEARLVFPEASNDIVSNLMIALTKHIDDSGHEKAVQGILGGEYGYGAHYKNDVFEMRPFYWGDCICDYDILRNQWEEDNEHAEDCYQTIYHDKHYVNYGGDGGWNFDLKDGHSWNDECIAETCAIFGIDPSQPGGAIHCTCSYKLNSQNFLKTIAHSDECEVDKPNFKHYASGVQIKWYKYIGRDMEYDDSISVEKWIEIFNECVNPIKLGGK